MSAADRAYKRAFLDRGIRPGDRVTVAAFGLGTLRRIAGNYAEIAFDADKSESVRIILFEDIGAL
jgi:protein involved in polysaccharide export with SLBB domain